ncbi:hypothetical protein CEXT_113821 [Caerostris extrusa]|uniref:Uncharacterized protein n=1 Tax=Caerostris extrusa TaxID=172846 RepID=A0AAV4RBW9_CAEEX|nr:hypothetical protein CEXT_113821 [Caerostris extrusa]
MENPTSEETNILRSRRSVSEIVSAPYLISGVDRFGRSVKIRDLVLQVETFCKLNSYYWAIYFEFGSHTKSMHEYTNSELSEMHLILGEENRRVIQCISRQRLYISFYIKIYASLKHLEATEVVQKDWPELPP